VVSGVSGVSEQINVSESGSELVVTATPSGSSTPVQLTGSPFSTSEIGSMDSISKKLNQSLEDAFQVVVTANGSGTDTLQLSAYSTSADPVSLYGGLYAGTGNDSLVGGSGNVVMVAGTGNDTLLGGTGAQSIADYQNYSQTLSVDLQDGTATKGSGQQDVLKNIDYVFGGSGSDTLKGGTGTSRIEAGTGTDFLEGGAGTGTTYLIASGCDKIGTFDTLQGGAGSTGFFMGGDNYKEYFENYNPTLDTTFSADQGIDFDLDTNSLYGNS
jgi:Ca2+-binding RTX toxin-like protein